MSKSNQDDQEKCTRMIQATLEQQKTIRLSSEKQFLYKWFKEQMLSQLKDTPWTQFGKETYTQQVYDIIRESISTNLRRILYVIGGVLVFDLILIFYKSKYDILSLTAILLQFIATFFIAFACFQKVTGFKSELNPRPALTHLTSMGGDPVSSILQAQKDTFEKALKVIFLALSEEKIKTLIHSFMWVGVLVIGFLLQLVLTLVK